MSETQTIDREAPGIADILARREGDLPPSMLPGEPEPAPRAEPTPAQDDAAQAAAELRRQNEQLQSRTSTAEAARLAAEAAARRATEELHRTRQTADDANYSTVTGAIEARTAEQARLRTEMKSAGEAGDYERLADINVRLGELGAEMVRLREGKEAYEADRGTRLREPAPTPTPPAGEWTTVGAPREQFLSSRTPKTQEWLRKNDRFFSDQSFFNVVTGADAIARGRGIAADTPEYFRFIEEQAGMTQPTSTATPPRNNGSSAPPAAPPSRDATGPSGHTTRAGDTYVTPEQARIAKWMDVDPMLYAQEEAEARRNGDIPHRRR
jgi:hypothetical protein